MFRNLFRRRSRAHTSRLSRPAQHLLLEHLEAREVLSAVAWTAGPSLAAPQSEATAILAPGDAVLMIGGSSNVVPKLTTAATAWTTSFPLDKALEGPGAVTTSAGRMFIFGGRDGTESTSEGWTYDYLVGDHQNISDMTVPRLDFGAAIDLSGHAYAIGGIDTDGNIVLDSVEQYSPSADTWSDMEPLPEPRRGMATATDTTGHIYVFGGSATTSTGGIESTTFRYDVASDSWTTLASMPLAVQDSAAVQAENGLIYVLGGLTSAGPTATVQVYDPATDSWSTDTDLPMSLYAHAAAIDGLSRILVAGGKDAAGQAVRNVYRSQRFDIPETAPVITSRAPTTGSLDSPYTYDVNATANPEATYSLVVAPAGMSIDTQTGVISWQPVEGQHGENSVTVRAENRVGFVDQQFVINVAFDTTPPTAPTALAIDAISTNSIDLSWQPATDNRGIAYYEVLKAYRTGFRGIKTAYAVIQTGITGTSTTLSGLAPLATYKLSIRAVDVAGNVSPRSNQVIAQTQAPPTLRYYTNGLINGSVSVVANHVLQITLAASANPAPTFALLDGPAGMTLDPTSGKVQWTPTATDVGRHTISVEATNSVGSDQLDIPITVTADLPVLRLQFDPNATGSSLPIAGNLLEMLVSDISLTPSTFELVSAPDGMTIEPVTGLIQWTPTVADAGPTLIAVRGTNSAGSTDMNIGFETYFTGSPTNIQVTGQTLLHPTVTWSAPTGAGAAEIEGYTLRATTRYRWGRAYRSHSVTVDVPGGATSTEIQGLLSGKTYKISISAYDANGHHGAFSTEAVTVVSVPAIPNVSWTVSNPNGGPLIANQPVHIQLNNMGIDPATFEIVDGPLGMTIDRATGLATWMPGSADVGTHIVKVRATNNVGPRDISLTLNVLFSGPVTNASAVRSGNSATVSWSAPAYNVSSIASYRITMHWMWSSRRRTRVVMVPGNQLSAALALIPTGAVYHTGVTIAPVDEFGHIGASTPLVRYGSAP
ncbi:MAG: fibronectin type III domain-containing protein [Pirellulaceae bacterium]